MFTITLMMAFDQDGRNCQVSKSYWFCQEELLGILSTTVVSNSLKKCLDFKLHFVQHEEQTWCHFWWITNFRRVSIKVHVVYGISQKSMCESEAHYSVHTKTLSERLVIVYLHK